MIGPSEAREAVAYDLAEDRETPIPYDVLRFNYANVVKQLAAYAEQIEAEQRTTTRHHQRQMTASGHLAAVVSEAARKGRKTIRIADAVDEATRRTHRALDLVKENPDD